MNSGHKKNKSFSYYQGTGGVGTIGSQYSSNSNRTNTTTSAPPNNVHYATTAVPQYSQHQAIGATDGTGSTWLPSGGPSQNEVNTFAANAEIMIRDMSSEQSSQPLRNKATVATNRIQVIENLHLAGNNNIGSTQLKNPQGLQQL